MGRITSKMDGLRGAFTYSYLSAASPRLASITYPDQQVTSFTYFDNIGDRRLKQISNLKPNASQLSKFDYTYNPVAKS